MISRASFTQGKAGARAVSELYKLCVYVPESHAGAVKEALFAAGAGRIGNYEACCWEVAGVGQFRPGGGADPFLGRPGELERVPALRIELVCPGDAVDAVITALFRSHPYEEPAWDLLRTENQGFAAAIARAREARP